MADRRPDRRIGRTKTRLKGALLELIDERGYERITIEQVAERADIGRSTFYSHYSSKEDLLFDGFDAWLFSLADTRETEIEGEPDPDRSFLFSLPLLEHIQSQKRFVKATILGGSDPGMRRKTTALLVELVRRELARMSPPITPPAPGPGARPHVKADGAAMREAQIHLVVGAFLGLVAWWLDSGDTLSAAAVDRVFQETARNALAASG